MVTSGDSFLTSGGGVFSVTGDVEGFLGLLAFAAAA